jgi:hypothetical protein
MGWQGARWAAPALALPLAPARALPRGRPHPLPRALTLVGQLLGVRRQAAAPEVRRERVRRGRQHVGRGGEAVGKAAKRGREPGGRARRRPAATARWREHAVEGVLEGEARRRAAARGERRREVRVARVQRGAKQVEREVGVRRALRGGHGQVRARRARRRDGLVHGAWRGSAAGIALAGCQKSALCSETGAAAGAFGRGVR